ncbi:MAG: hypothetical protein ABI233_03030 [Chthoniobacterales bacterium]
MDAAFELCSRAFGAVGFLNSVADSPPNKAAIKAKFRNDLASAKRADPGLSIFVFFTNVSLTVGERSELIAHAVANGIALAEIYDRERLRIALDSPEGFGFRFQYLDIPLSKAEQASFFSRWGSDLESIITKRASALDARLSRLEFIQEQSRPLTSIYFGMKLSRGFSREELPHVRALLSLQLSAIARAVGGRPTILNLIVANDRGERAAEHHLGEPGLVRYAWISHDDISNPRSPQRDLYYRPEVENSISATLRVSPFTHTPILNLKLGDLDNSLVRVYANAHLAAHVKQVTIIANEYIVWQAFRSELSVEQSDPGPRLPFDLTEDEKQDDWMQIKGRFDTGWMDFARFTPRRLMAAEQIVAWESERQSPQHGSLG